MNISTLRLDSNPASTPLHRAFAPLKPPPYSLSARRPCPAVVCSAKPPGAAAAAASVSAAPESPASRIGGLSQVSGVLGCQWGDEGKGKLVDILARHFDVVARCQVSLGIRCVLVNRFEYMTFGLVSFE
ncbi:hypothetical protein BT93_L3955 [Corymbia citriodora subsp. variegata]|uniref:Adenylosuccinate synthetase n=1 Tax=Corymbia citriodora subsp. variegata TaxID=360336 RepID=A0A8T0CGG2_CORYI|nr:hypothetical protein BT93_L3955 [Corymbia citriodora subsp. variegata]